VAVLLRLHPRQVRLGDTRLVPSPLDEPDTEWLQTEHCVVNWFYTTLHKCVFNIVYKPRASAFTIWVDIEGLFRDNKMQRAVYLEAEFRSLRQDDMSITDYTTRLKTLADSLRYLGQPVSQPSQCSISFGVSIRGIAISSEWYLDQNGDAPM
jgi:hypothetical protein